MSKVLKNVRIARVSTIPFFVVTQLSAQLEALAFAGADVCIIASNDETADKIKKIKGCRFNPISIAREISVWKDLISLVKLWKLFRKERFHLVHSTTPKAGLLCAIAARCAGVPICIHTYTGQTWVTMSGMKKRLVQWSDKLIATLNPLCYTDSYSQSTFLTQNKIISADKIKVIGSGSLAGVDLERFSLGRFSKEDNCQLKNSLNIDDAAKILLFVGRITKEKGVFELFEAMRYTLQQGLNVVLIVVGPFEQYNEHEVRIAAQKMCADKIRFVGFQADPERYIAITDILCLPSYREGFGTVVIEAAAMQVPTVGTNIYGLNDAVVNGVTGILVEPINSTQLAEAIQKLLADDILRKTLGEQARERSINEFDSRMCNELLVQEYKQLLNSIRI